jgi:hypothetical protein
MMVKTPIKRNSPVGKSFELFAKDYKFNVPQGVYLENVEKATYLILIHSLVEPLLARLIKLRTLHLKTKYLLLMPGEIVKNKWRNPLFR